MMMDDAPPPIVADVAARLRQAFKDTRITSRQLAVRAEVDERTVRRILAGQTDMQLSTLWKVCRALKLLLEDVVRERAA